MKKYKKGLRIFLWCCILSKYLVNGGVAQLGERLHGMQEVRGSIPLVSTILL